jgi:hypothetical protein
MTNASGRKRRVSFASVLKETRHYAVKAGLEEVPTGTTHQNELRYYFTHLMFGTSIRLERIAAALKNRPASRLREIVASEQPHLTEELGLCSDIFQTLLGG